MLQVTGGALSIIVVDCCWWEEALWGCMERWIQELLVSGRMNFDVDNSLLKAKIFKPYFFFNSNAKSKTIQDSQESELIYY